MGLWGLPWRVLPCRIFAHMGAAGESNDDPLEPPAERVSFSENGHTFSYFRAIISRAHDCYVCGYAYTIQNATIIPRSNNTRLSPTSVSFSVCDVCVCVRVSSLLVFHSSSFNHSFMPRRRVASPSQTLRTYVDYSKHHHHHQ